MIERLAHEAQAAWPSLAPGRPAPRQLHVLKWDVADYPHPARALVFFLFADADEQPIAVAKVARSADGDARVVHEAGALARLRNVLPLPLATSIPVLVWTGTINERAGLVASALPGEVEMHHTWPVERAGRAEARLRQALDWCTRFAQATASGTVTASEWLGREIVADLGPLATLGLASEVREKLAALLPMALASSWPAAFAHGDYFPGNVLFGPRGEVGVVDWALAEPASPAFFDGLTYELSFSMQRAFAQRPIEAGLLQRVHELPAFAAWRAGWERAGIDLDPGGVARICTALYAARRDALAGAERADAARAWLRVLELEVLAGGRAKQRAVAERRP